MECQTRIDYWQKNKQKACRVQRTCRKDLSGLTDKGRSGQRGTYQEAFARYCYPSNNAACHEQGRIAIRQRVRVKVKDGGNLSEPVLLRQDAHGVCQGQRKRGYIHYSYHKGDVRGVPFLLEEARICRIDHQPIPLLVEPTDVPCGQ